MRTPAQCPACGTAASSALAFPRSGQAFLRCRVCGTLHVHPRPDTGDVEAFYRQGYWEEFVSSRGHPTLAERMEDDDRYAEFALRRDVLPLGLEGRLLDVGAATGAYVAAARAEGFDADGVEPSDSARAVARRRHGLVLHAGTLETAGLPPACYDVVVARDVLEHVTDPLAFLSAGRKVMAPGAHLVLETPTASSPGLARDGSCWFLADPGMHLQLLTEVGAARLLGRAGLVLRAVYSPNEENMVVVARRPGAEAGAA